MKLLIVLPYSTSLYNKQNIDHSTSSFILVSMVCPYYIELTLNWYVAIYVSAIETIDSVNAVTGHGAMAAIIIVPLYTFTEF